MWEEEKRARWNTLLSPLAKRLAVAQRFYVDRVYLHRQRAVSLCWLCPPTENSHWPAESLAGMPAASPCRASRSGDGLLTGAYKPRSSSLGGSIVLASWSECPLVVVASTH